MGVVCVAKTLADALGGPRSIYDAHVALKCIPYLDDESNGDDGDAVVGDVMATAVRCVPDVAPHAAVACKGTTVRMSERPHRKAVLRASKPSCRLSAMSLRYLAPQPRCI